MRGLADLTQSERGAFCILALVAATVLVVVGKLDSAMWLDFSKWLAAALVAGKTVTTAVETYTLKQPQIAPQPTPARVFKGEGNPE